MRILLTGATGFVGRAFLKSITPDAEVLCIGRTKPDRLDVKFVQTDLQDPRSVRDAADKLDGNFDALIHLAAYVPRQGAEDLLQESNNVNVSGLVNLLDEFKGRFNSLVIGSTAEVYDQARISGPIHEDSPVGPGSFYGATKLAGEYIAQTFGKKNNIPTVILRFSVMYGPDDPIARALPNFIKSALRGDDIQISGGQNLRDYIHIDDVVRSISLAVDSKKSGVVNIGTGKGVTIEDAARQVVAAANSVSQIQINDKEGNAGVDIVIDTRVAERLIGFRASTIFPDKLGEMIDSYR